MTATGGAFKSPEVAESRDGTRIAYWSAGRGPSVLMVHGLGNYHGPWEPMVPLLARWCTVVAIDRRGRGASGDNLPYAFEREFEDVAAVAEAIGPTSVLGHSLGSSIALEAALLTHAITGLILYEGWPDPGDDMSVLPDSLPALEALTAAGKYAEVLAYDEPPEELEALRRGPHWDGYVSAAASSARELRGIYEFWAAHPLTSGRWRDLSIPILILYGEHNPGQGVGAGELAADLQDGRVQMLAGQGHYAYRDDPQLLAAAIVSFVGSLPAEENPLPRRVTRGVS